MAGKTNQKDWPKDKGGEGKNRGGGSQSSGYVWPGDKRKKPAQEILGGGVIFREEENKK